jgi:hypothetical protein
MYSFNTQILATLKNAIFSTFISFPRLFESPAPEKPCKKGYEATAVESYCQNEFTKFIKNLQELSLVLVQLVKQRFQIINDIQTVF